MRKNTVSPIKIVTLIKVSRQKTNEVISVNIDSFSFASFLLLNLVNRIYLFVLSEGANRKYLSASADIIGKRQEILKRVFKTQLE